MTDRQIEVLLTGELAGSKFDRLAELAPHLDASVVYGLLVAKVRAAESVAALTQLLPLADQSSFR